MSEKQDECNHYWIAPTKEDGSWDFRLNRQMCPVPLLKATCRKCNSRTWFTEEQWAAIPIRSEP